MKKLHPSQRASRHTITLTQRDRDALRRFAAGRPPYRNLSRTIGAAIEVAAKESKP